MAEDYLKNLPEAQVAAWYYRLAALFAKTKVGTRDSLAAELLKHWLDNRDPKSTYTFSTPEYLKTSPYVENALKYQRRVFLTEEKARVGDVTRWAGIVPRLKGTGYAKWVPEPGVPLTLEYESLVEVGTMGYDLYRIMNSGTAEERDLFTSLRGFQLHSKVLVTATPIGKTTEFLINFISWECYAKDRYDWDYNEHLPMPNPDFQQTTLKDAVRPQDQKLTVFHKNAERLEKKKLAAPYDVLSGKWTVVSAAITGQGKVDADRWL